ncbi:hypothetical protein VNO77_38928 [Canavalia gladiata]|uniref:Uncharacterized protein n=1 Tax=Canavalia gladiata TaxID=3824 RepID=A0AAN9KBL1_CANGL
MIEQLPMKPPFLGIDLVPYPLGVQLTETKTTLYERTLQLHVASRGHHCKPGRGLSTYIQVAKVVEVKRTYTWLDEDPVTVLQTVVITRSHIMDRRYSGSMCKPYILESHAKFVRILAHLNNINIIVGC